MKNATPVQYRTQQFLSLGLYVAFPPTIFIYSTFPGSPGWLEDYSLHDHGQLINYTYLCTYANVWMHMCITSYSRMPYIYIASVPHYDYIMPTFYQSPFPCFKSAYVLFFNRIVSDLEHKFPAIQQLPTT